MPNNENPDAREKVNFRLVQDAEGYPPLSAESVWAERVAASTFKIDNIPFFTREATFGDTVHTMEEDGHHWFSRLAVPSENSLVRVALFEPSKVDELRQRLGQLGCSTEWDKPHRLVSVNVPVEASLEAVQEYLMTESARGWLDYEEPILRQ
jgi:hypothetical protein